MDQRKVRDDELWSRIQNTLLMAMAIFVFTIIIGILNAVDAVEFTRAEKLFHLHSGTIGWISLSAVVIMVWFYTGERDLSENSSRQAKNLLRYVQIIIPIYVALFYLGFTLASGDDLFRVIPTGDGSSYWFILLVVGAIAATGGFFWAVYFGVTELKLIEERTTPHYLFLGAMITSTYGGIFGMVLELQNLFEVSFFDVTAGQDGIATHVAAMETGYLYMIIVGIIEWQGMGLNLKSVSLSGFLEVLFLFFAGFSVAIGAGFNIPALVILNLPFMLLGVGILIGRVVIRLDWKSIKHRGPSRYYLPATFFLLFSVGVFLYLVYQFITGDDATDLSSSPFFGNLFLANNHALFIGATSTVIFACLTSIYTTAQETSQRIELIGIILMFVGLIGFMSVLVYRGILAEDGKSTEAANVNTHVAAVMGIGLFMIMFSFLIRYRKMKNAA